MLQQKDQPSFLVSKPMFDVRQLKPGTAIRVVADGWTPVNGSRAWNAIVTEATPLAIKVWRHIERDPYDRDDFEDNPNQLAIDINHVTSGQVQIEILRNA